MSNTPSDAEIVELAISDGIKVRTGAGVVRLVRSALAKWGTPQPVVREPLTHAQAKALVLKYGNDPLHLVYQVEVAHGIKGGQHG